jgi:hypothetical protein
MPPTGVFVARTCVQRVAVGGTILPAAQVVTGLSSESTRTLVASGVDIGDIHAIADLQRGIEEAPRLLVSRDGRR